MVVMYFSQRGRNTCTARPLTFKGLNTEILIKINKHTTGATSGAGTPYPSGAPEFSPGFQWGSCYSISSFMCMFCSSLFVLLYFFFWPLCCLFFFDIRILITPLVSSNSSFNQNVFINVVICLSSSFLLVVIKKDNLLSAPDKSFLSLSIFLFLNKSISTKQY